MTRVERYRECAKRGMSIGDTARLYGVTLNAIRQCDKRHGLGFKRKPMNKGRDLIACRERMQNLAAAGKSCREIAVEMQVPFDTVGRWARQWAIRFQSGRQRKPVMEMVSGLLTEQEAEDLRLLKSNGYRFRDAFVAMKRPDLLQYLPQT